MDKLSDEFLEGSEQMTTSSFTLSFHRWTETLVPLEILCNNSLCI